MGTDKIVVVKDNMIRLSFLPSDLETREDGSIWNVQTNRPLLCLSGSKQRKELIALCSKGEFDSIPKECFLKYGQNGRCWVGPLSAWRVWRKYEEMTIREIFLSTRGCGDYFPLLWKGDITKDENEILQECRDLLDTAYDVDDRSLSDEKILEMIREAKASFSHDPLCQDESDREELNNLIKSGYCFHCGTWCYGDCGHYEPTPGLDLDLKFKEYSDDE